MTTTATATAREPREASGREGRDSHGRRPHSSSRSRRDDPSPRRRRDERRHEPDRSQHRRRAEEGADDAGSRDERRSRHLQEAKARSGGPDPGHGEGKPPPPSDAKEDPPARHERSPRGTKRFSETREAWRPRSSFFQIMEDKGIKMNISMIEINTSLRDMVCKKRLGRLNNRVMLILHGSMMGFSSWRKTLRLPKGGQDLRRWECHWRGRNQLLLLQNQIQDHVYQINMG